jgi:hypothetical protein
MSRGLGSFIQLHMFKDSSSSKVKFESSSKYQYVEGTTKHFSNFAVLLLGAYQINGCRPTLWIAHVSVTAGVLSCLFFLVSFSHL